MSAGVPSYFNSFLKSVLRKSKIVQDAPKIIDVKGRAPISDSVWQNRTSQVDFLLTDKANKGARRLHITTRHETSKNRPQPK